MAPLFRILAAGFLLTVTGCGSKPGVDDLLSSEPAERGRALSRLIALPEADVAGYIAPLAAALGDTDPRRVERAVDALAIIGEPAVPALKTTLAETENPFAQISAAQAVGLLGRRGQAAVPELIDLLRHAHPLVRDEAAQALGRIGRPAAPAVPALAGALEDADAAVRSQAEKALKQIGTEQAEAALANRPAKMS